jgi:tetratricopeptide (TPR) repeat protein
MSLARLILLGACLAFGLVVESWAFAQQPQPLYVMPLVMDETVSTSEQGYIRDVVAEELGALFWLNPFSSDEAAEVVGEARAAALAACANPRCAVQVLRAVPNAQLLVISITRISRGVYQMEAAVMDNKGRTALKNRAVEKGGPGELKYAMTGFLEDLFAVELKKHAGNVTTIVETTAITSTEADRLLDQADEAADAGRADEAISLYEQGAAQASTLALPWIRISRLKLEAQDPIGARDAARSAVAREQHNLEAQLALGEAELAADNPKAAESAFRRVLQADPKHLKAMFMLGVLLTDLGKNAEAARLFEDALTLDPDQAAARVNLGLVYMKQSKWTQARTHLEKAVAQDDRLLSAYPALADVYEQLKEWTNALSIYLKLAEKTDSCAACWFNAGRMAAQLGNERQAISYYEQTIELDADYLDAYYSLGRLLVAGEDCEEAVRLLGVYVEKETRADQAAYVKRARQLMTSCATP